MIFFPDSIHKQIVVVRIEMIQISEREGDPYSLSGNSDYTWVQSS